jgi:hypothetical protein
MASEEGVTMIEVLVGAVCAVAVVTAVALGLASNNTAALATQRQAQLVAVLQARMENLHQLFTETYAKNGFSAFSLSKNPAQGEDSSLPKNPKDPNDFITPYVPSYEWNNGVSSPEKFLIENNYNNTSEGTVENGHTSETLLVEPSIGRVAPVVYVDLTTGKTYGASGEVPSGDPYAIVNTYITIATQAETSSSTSCPTTNGTGSNAADTVRVIVAARLAPVSGRPELGAPTPQYSTTLFANPVPANQCQSADGPHIGLNLP